LGAGGGGVTGAAGAALLSWFATGPGAALLSLFATGPGAASLFLLAVGSGVGEPVGSWPFQPVVLPACRTTLNSRNIASFSSTSRAV
jgi:hypothetical protein